MIGTVRRLFIVAVASLALASCATKDVISNSTGGVTAQNVQAVIDAVRTDAQTVCNFVPDATVVAAILSAIGGGASAAIVPQVVGMICAAIARRSGAGAPVVRVRGKAITIKGRFIRTR